MSLRKILKTLKINTLDYKVGIRWHKLCKKFPQLYLLNIKIDDYECRESKRDKIRIEKRILPIANGNFGSTNRRKNQEGEKIENKYPLYRKVLPCGELFIYQKV